MASPFRTFNLNVAGGLGIFSGGILLWILYHGPTAAQIGAGSLTTVRGVSVTDTRASNKTCNTNASGSTVTILSTNQPCVDTVGLNVEGSATNTALQSNGFTTAPWSMDNTTAVQNAVAPDGTTTAWTWTNSTSNTQHRDDNTTALSATGTWTWSIYAKAGTASFLGLNFTNAGIATFNVSSGVLVNADPGITASVVSVGNGWYRCIATMTNTGGAHAILMFGETAAQAESLFGAYAGNTTTILLWGMQVESGSFATSYIATTGTTATRTADDVRVANPLNPGNPASWSIAATVTPSFWSGTQGVLSFGTGYASPNTANMRMTSGQPNCDVYDNAGNGKTFVATASISAAAHRLACQSNNGTVTLLVDGVAVAGTASGTGTGIISTQSATAMLGQIQTGGTNPLWGQMTDVCIAQTATGCR